MRNLKIFKSIIFALSTVFLIGFGISNVKAGSNDTQLVKDRFEGIYAVYDGYDQTHVFFAQRYVMNGITAYCIEPGAPIDSFTYSSTDDWSITGMSNETRRYVMLLAYYGYDYPGHENYRYYIAAQELIWQAVTGRGTYWTTENSQYGPKINIDNEKNEILSLVNSHYNKPSFNDKTFEISLGEKLTLNDSNNVLSSYQLYNSDLNNISIDGNILTVVSDSNIGEKNIQLIKKNYLNRVALIYHSGSNQKIVSAGIVDPSISTLKIKTVGGNITGNKLDIKTGSTPQGDAILNGAKYGIYNSNNELVDTLVIGTNNTSKTLPYGTYTVKELVASKGYTLSDKVETVTINSNNQNPTIDLYEKVISNKYEFHKILTSDLTSIINAEKNIKFDVYLKSSNQLFTSFTTDENGKASVELPYGTYVVKQVNSTKNYRKVKDFEIVVNKDSSEEKSMLLTDNEITAKLKVIKIDADTGNVVKRANIKFKIKSLDTNEYVCQTITYPNTVEVCEYETDENGEFITPYPLHSGKYTLEEVDQKIDGYLWNKESN